MVRPGRQASAALFSLALALCPAARATSRNCSRPDGLVDLGYARHVPTYVNATDSGRNVIIYKNIRFGNPPVGNLRFRRPDTNLPEQKGIQDGHAPWGSRSCIATAPDYIPYPGYNGTTWGHEDCLFLDVYVAPGVKPGDKVPVLHLFFGSAYAFLDKDTYLFNPMGLFDGSAEENKFIFVVNNYRLGMPGWTSVPGLDMDANVGMHDCLAAARWTSKFIDRFGGDPDQITVIGQSAGAGIINYLTTLNGGQGKLPFQRAFSSSPAIPPRRNTTARRQELFQAVLDATNCTDLTCLRSVPESVMLEANSILINGPSGGGGGVYGPAVGFGPVPGDELTPDMPEALYRQGLYHKELKGLIVGTMANERMGTNDDTGMPERFPFLARKILTTASNETIAAVQALYTDLSEPAQLSWDWTTDILFACNAYNTAKAYSDRTRRYIMSIPPAVHGQDVSYYFYVNQEQTPVSDPELVAPLQKALLEFVYGKEPSWPLYGDDQRIFNITSNGYVETMLPEKLWKRCEFLNDVFLDPANGV